MGTVMNKQTINKEFLNKQTVSKQTKQKTLFNIKNKKNQINMNVDEALYNHFQTLTPLQQKAVQDLMTLKLLQQNNQ